MKFRIIEKTGENNIQYYLIQIKNSLLGDWYHRSAFYEEHPQNDGSYITDGKFAILNNARITMQRLINEDKAEKEKEKLNNKFRVVEAEKC